MTRPFRGCKATVATGRGLTDEIGIPTKAPQELPIPAPCVGLLILPIRQMIGPGSTQRRSTAAVLRATQTATRKKVFHLSH